MKNKDNKKKLPQFKTTTLGPDELSQATGGQACPATQTRNQCHIDGTDD